ncbi:phage tail tube protein [Peptostreptococcus anaerobius]|uniref:Phage-like element PBSX protein xkdM n=1 Tax=Peptostreptococcus anaerobius TaxID=1261 RepID=A0A379CFH5_9FIRM|nr:phage tail tube protein [Peptostreptococcus anaerobius]MDU1663951.1 phage tail tube protein [Peptoniphilus harei]EKX89276.1 hypothetical protein HMPREF9998_01711 [Peptostreptococcus anaerobius VPI 4330 = DSM 2949]MDU1599144.1 phage tail tube protein [Peptostreptococcus anaerobius]MDU1682229.1 phage tail tube protein [Peptostreptococcus anaerobius]SFM69371.1 Phage tail tube protein [Peptostreptococcus anaerobius]
MDYSKMKFSQEKPISGTWGEVWLNGEYVSECKGMQAKIDFDKEKITMPRDYMVGHKIMSAEGKGSVTLFKMTSRMITLISEKFKNGESMEFTIVSKLADPQSYGVERISLEGVIFDDLTLADWKRNEVGETEAPFTFAGYDPMDTI